MNNNHFCEDSEAKSLIEEILKIDKIAHDKLLHEKELESKMLKKIKIKKQEISTQLNHKAKQQLEKLEAFEQKEFEIKLEELKRKKEQSVMNLKQLYEKNKTKWIELTISNTLKLSN